MGSLMDEINKMTAEAGAIKAAADSKSKETERQIKHIRRKSRDLNLDVFGMFQEELDDAEKAFKKFDTDGNGSISQSELREALGSDGLLKGSPIPPNEVFARMINKFADVSLKEGGPKTELSKAAFGNLVNAIKKQDYKNFLLDEFDEQLERLFIATDTDQSGTISRTELKLALKNVDDCKDREFDEKEWEKVMTFADEPEKSDVKDEFSLTAFSKLVYAIKKGFK